ARRDRGASRRLRPRPGALPRAPHGEGTRATPRREGRVRSPRAPRGGKPARVTTHYDFLTGDAQRDRRNVDLILGAVEELNSQGDIVAKMRSAVDRAILLTGAARGILMLPDEKGALSVRVARKSGSQDLPLSVNYSRTISGKVWA